MIGAVEKLMLSYLHEGIDIWKDCLSTPGISRILLMKSAQKQSVIFPLIDEGDKDLFYIFKSQIVAGPSIVFTRECYMLTKVHFSQTLNRHMGRWVLSKT